MRLSEKGSSSKVPRGAILVASVLLAARVSASLVDTLSTQQSGDVIKWINVDAALGNRLVVDNPRRLPILYEFYSSTDEYSKNMNHLVLRNRELEKLIREKFVAVRISDANPEKGVTPKIVINLLRRFSVARVPCLIVTNAEGKELARLDGYKPAAMVYQMLAMALYHPPKSAPADDEKQNE